MSRRSKASELVEAAGNSSQLVACSDELPAQMWELPAQMWAWPAQMWELPAQMWELPAQMWEWPAQMWELPAQMWVEHLLHSTAYETDEYACKECYATSCLYTAGVHVSTNIAVVTFQWTGTF